MQQILHKTLSPKFKSPLSSKYTCIYDKIFVRYLYTLLLFYTAAMSLLQEFKNFAMKGNVIDLAVWVVIWGAFFKIVSSLVEYIITPFVGMLIMGANFSELSFWIVDAKIKYGMFIQATIDFTIVAVVLFLLVKGIKKTQALNKKKEEK